MKNLVIELRINTEMTHVVALFHAVYVVSCRSHLACPLANGQVMKPVCFLYCLLFLGLRYLSSPLKNGSWLWWQKMKSPLFSSFSWRSQGGLKGWSGEPYLLFHLICLKLLKTNAGTWDLLNLHFRVCQLRSENVPFLGFEQELLKTLNWKL